MMRYGWVGMALVVLTACKQPPPGPPPWALGEQPNFSGQLEYWAKGDAIAPGEGGIFAYSYLSDPEGELLGIGKVKPDGSLTFGLVRQAGGHAVPVEQALCSGLSLSSPQQKIAVPEVLEVPALYTEGVHARPGGGVLISTSHPVSASNPQPPRYSFVYADQDGSIRGTCTGFAIHLELRKGWNSIVGQGSVKTAALPGSVKWYFINPLTAAL